ncbi:MAG: ERCC4 domain-containing protein [Candidatus Izemoplasmatales bacterium]|jgi:ERCC4-type nuclease
MGITAVMIDSREPQWVKSLGFGGCPVVVTTLEAGDFWVSTDDNEILVIERKTPEDFLGTLGQGRLFVQGSLLQQQRNAGKWPYLLVTGEIRSNADGFAVIERRETKWRWNDIQGALLSMQELGVFVHFCNGDSDLEAAIVRLANRDRRPEMKVPPPRAGNHLSLQERALCALPGIGEEIVGRLLEFCGSAGAAIAVCTELNSSIKIPGIGPGMKNNIRFALGLNEGQELHLLDPETIEFLQNPQGEKTNGTK